MNAFDKIIGYETIKTELLQICDMIHNRKIYDDLGAKLPQGILLYGNPGLGKTLMAKCFIEESGLQAFTVRRNKGSDDFIGEITDTFARAKEHAPSIVFLDDMDKFANEDDNHTNAEEYVAVQSGIDEVKNCDVFVIATVNEKRKLPISLTRVGRFDRRIEIKCPTGKDAAAIITHYLADKKVSDSVNMEDLTKMISYSSCAELETILNEAAIKAGYNRKEQIEMEDLVQSVLGMEYDSPDNYVETSAEKMQKIALHEAGHLVVCEALEPGSVGLASIRIKGRDTTGGFIHRCKELSRETDHILTCLAGKAAVELYYSEECADGCANDINRAFNYIRKEISEQAYCGFGMIDVAVMRFPDTSESMNSRNEAVTQAELERYMIKTKDILLKNRAFLEKAAEALMEKETLLYSDICEIKKNVDIIYMQY
ncbi:MAG: AAA family ATPase [Lachnospiraceae bacterium]|nr:AAA family ATPase [Lachnospiraceae bacterium]